jgi:hypothetical protein
VNARPLPLLLVLAALPALHVPAASAADGGGDIVGATCGLAAYAAAGSDVRTGVVMSGPWYPTRNGVTVLAVACSVQVGSDDPFAPDAARVSAAGSVLAPTPVSYGVPNVGLDVFVCTEVTVFMPPQAPTVEYYDADPKQPGPQCRKATTKKNEVLVVDVAPSDPTTWWCVRVDHGLPPYGYQEVCNPFA